MHFKAVQLMTYKELYYFIGICLSIDDRPDRRGLIMKKLLSNEIDWEKFVKLCSNHLILQVVYLKFQSHNLLKYLPCDLVEHLENIYNLNHKRNIQILHQIEEITSALNKSGIYPVFLKGTANLLDGIYSDPGERIIGDIDLLVPEKDYVTAALIVEGTGYIKDEWPDYIVVSSQKHYPRLWRNDVPADIEIHRLPQVDKYLKWFNPEMIFNDKVPVAKYTGAYVPSDKHKIMHNFIHSQLADSRYYFGIISFRDLYDLYLYSKRTGIGSIINDLPARRKAINYFALGGKILDLPGRFCPIVSNSSAFYALRHDLNLTSPFFYKTDHFIRKLIQIFYNSYISKFFEFFYSKSIRQEIIGKLKDPKWYGIHFKRYTDLLN
jgi:hypothetical protein